MFHYPSTYEIRDRTFYNVIIQTTECLFICETLDISRFMRDKVVERSVIYVGVYVPAT